MMPNISLLLAGNFIKSLPMYLPAEVYILLQSFNLFDYEKLFTEIGIMTIIFFKNYSKSEMYVKFHHR